MERDQVLRSGGSTVTFQRQNPDFSGRFQSLVKMVGQLRDRVRLCELQRASQQARELLELMPTSGEIDWPELRVDPVARCGFLRERIAGMNRLMARKRLTTLDFHQIKKHFRLV